MERERIRKGISLDAEVGRLTAPNLFRVSGK